MYTNGPESETIQPPGPWASDALCREADDPDIFFPAVHDQQAAAKARQVCGCCPVRDQCLEYAFANDERHGIWGGLDPAERAALKRSRRDRARRARRRNAA